MFGFNGVDSSIKLAKEQFEKTKRTANEIMEMARKANPQLALAHSHGNESGKIVKFTRNDFKTICESNRNLAEQTKTVLSQAIENEQKKERK
jgi:hypothetical protein